MMGTGIEWTDETWNPVTGCDRVSEGCDNCYIERTIPFRIEGRRFDEAGRMGIRLHPDRLDNPLRWRRPRRVFVNSLADLYHPAVPDEFITTVFATMGLAERHSFQVLTKRPARMARHTSRTLLGIDDADGYDTGAGLDPLPNVWMGTSIELDKYTWRADHVRRTPAAVRWLSLEPLLGPLPSLDLTGIDWVVAGGESGPRARPMHPDWVRSIQARCQDGGIPFLFKQWGTWAPIAPVYDQDGNTDVIIEGHDRTRIVAVDNTGHTIATLPAPGHNLDDLPPPDGAPWWMARVGKKAAGRQLDGRSWDQYPDEDDRGEGRR